MFLFLPRVVCTCLYCLLAFLGKLAKAKQLGSALTKWGVNCEDSGSWDHSSLRDLCAALSAGAKIYFAEH